MVKIVVFGGTTEGRKLAEAFRNTELEMHICVATEYGEALLPSGPLLRVHAGRMDEEAMERFFAETVPDYCLDATHPYAAAATENIYEACRKQKIPYIRVLREEGRFHGTQTSKGTPLVIYKDSVEEAVSFFNEDEEGKKGNILLTTGSRDLEYYTGIKDYKTRCIARVLPTVQVMEKCRTLGFEGRNLIGMQGPFSGELNYWMLKQTKAGWMVTKNSGKEGGYQEKCGAALRAGVNIMVIGRRRDAAERELQRGIRSAAELEGILRRGQGAVVNLSMAIRFLAERCGMCERQEVYLIGAGPGGGKLLTEEAKECLAGCDIILGASRVLEICRAYGDRPFFACYKKEDILAFLKEHPEFRRAAVVYSGDIGFHSGARGLRELLTQRDEQAPEGAEGQSGTAFKVHPVSGISAPLYFLNRLGVPWEDVRLVSCHGRELNLIPLIRREKRVCVLVGSENAAARICERLLEFHMEHVKITVGERLSYPEERIVKGAPQELKGMETDPLSVILLENPRPEKQTVSPGIRDDFFLRGDSPAGRIPMTKEEVRVLSLSRLCLTGDFVLYDIGAGTGSVSVEAALLCPSGLALAIERSPEAAELIRENRRKSGAENLEIIEGEAPSCLAGLPVPTHAFIGGSGGKLLEIIQAVYEKNKDARFVINGITLETMAQIEEIGRRFPQYADMEVIQVNVSRGKRLGGYHLMCAENPVYIVSFGGEVCR